MGASGPSSQDRSPRNKGAFNSPRAFSSLLLNRIYWHSCWSSQSWQPICQIRDQSTCVNPPGSNPMRNDPKDIAEGHQTLEEAPRVTFQAQACHWPWGLGPRSSSPSECPGETLVLANSTTPQGLPQWIESEVRLLPTSLCPDLSQSWTHQEIVTINNILK